MADAYADHSNSMKLAIKDTKLYPAKVRNGGFLRRAWFKWQLMWDAALVSEAGDPVGVAMILLFAIVPIADVCLAFSPGISKLWLLDVVPYAICMGGFFGGGWSSVARLKKLSEVVTRADRNLGKQLASSIATLNKALPDAGLGGEAGNLLAKQIQETLLDIGVLAETVVEGREVAGFDANVAMEQLRRSVAEVAELASSIEELAAPRRELRVIQETELKKVKWRETAAKHNQEIRSKAEQLNSAASQKVSKLSAADQNLSALREHITEVAKAQKELTEQVGN